MIVYMTHITLTYNMSQFYKVLFIDTSICRTDSYVNVMHKMYMYFVEFELTHIMCKYGKIISYLDLCECD